MNMLLDMHLERIDLALFVVYLEYQQYIPFILCSQIFNTIVLTL